MSEELQPKILQPNGWAFLDWMTGVVRINCSSSVHASLKQKLEASGASGLLEDEILLLETVTHESFHYFQICTSAYLYNLVGRLHEAFSKQLEKYPVKRYEDLENWPIQSVRGEFQFHVSLLNHKGPEGLTPLHLLEGAAFYMQKRHHWNGLTPAYFDQQRAGEDVEYTFAYDLAEKILGQDLAFQMFPLLVAMSFWTAQPNISFVDLCRRLGGMDQATRSQTNLQNLLHEISPHVLGRPLLPPQTSDLRMYDQTIRHLDSLYASGQLNLPAVMAQPHDRIDAALANITKPAIVFDDQEGKLGIDVPDHFWPEHPRKTAVVSGQRAELMKRVILLFELSMRIQS